MAAITRPGSAGYGIRLAGSFAGKTIDAGVVADAFLSSQTASIGIKKPGIPSSTQPWLKTTLEIIMGRRGNRVTIPAKPALTFSPTPTQAECEALLAHTEEVRAALEQIITRLDS